MESIKDMEEALKTLPQKEGPIGSTLNEKSIPLFADYVKDEAWMKEFEEVIKKKIIVKGA